MYGPNAACVPGAGTAIVNCVILNGDPGMHQLLTGLTLGANYKVQIKNNDCGGGSDRHATFCISINNPATNGLPAGASVIDACGTAFNGTTAGGTWNSGTGSTTGFSNLDGNAATTCSICGVGGNDVPYVTNNTSWFTFCAVNPGTWRVTVDNVSGCRLSGLNSGVQASIFTGTPAALNFVQTTSAAAPFRLAPGGSWTSNTFAVGAGACALISVDGFAGDECNYSLTLTNMSGGCVLLASHISSFVATPNIHSIDIDWVTQQESNTQEFIIEKSVDGVEFTPIGVVAAAGNSSAPRQYRFVDSNPRIGYNYYRLRQVFLDGNALLSRMIVVNVEKEDYKNISVFPNPVVGDMSVSWVQVGNQPIQLSICDFTGKELKSQQISAAEGVNIHAFDVHQLPKGMYILRLFNNENYKQVKFLKD